MGNSQHTQNIQINKVIGESEKCVLFNIKKKPTCTFWPTQCMYECICETIPALKNSEYTITPIIFLCLFIFSFFHFCLPLQFRSHSPPPATTHLFSSTVSLYFLEFYVNEIIRMLFVWLLSFSKIIVRLIYIVTCNSR